MSGWQTDGDGFDIQVKQIFRRVGGGVRFRHNLIQQQIAKSHRQPREAEARSEMRRPVLALAGVFLALAVLDVVRFSQGWTSRLGWPFIDLLRLALIILVVSGAGYLFLMRRQGITFRETMFNWPMVAVAGVVALLLLFTAPIFPGLGA
jgi:cation transport ATPase